MKHVLTIDIETYSEIDIARCGSFKYIEDPSFEILLIGYKVDDQPSVILDLTENRNIPKDLVKMLEDPDFIKVAHNAFFEMTALSKEAGSLGINVCIDQWVDTMIMSYTLGLPGALDKCGEILKLDIQKDKIGKTLINYFCKPCAPTKANCYRTRNLPKHDSDRWELFKRYNATDCDTEYELYMQLEKFPNPTYERMWKEWSIDYGINSRGVKIDQQFTKNAMDFGIKYSTYLKNELLKITGVDNPNSNAQLKNWIYERTGVMLEELTKKTDLSAIDDAVVLHVFKLRNELQKTSLKKYETMLASSCEDERARGLLQFYGASTGRWAGRLIQVQNLPKNKMEDLDIARQIVREGDYDTFISFYDKPSDVLSELIRTSFIPSKDKFIVADYNAIEARVIAWLAKEQWVSDVFKNGQDIYKATASQMFNIPVDQVTKDLRGKGKIATLALGYQGSTGALTAMGALKMGISEDELPDIVKRWRKANPHIVALWNYVQDCAANAINNPGASYSLPCNRNVVFKKSRGILFVYLPSGRCLKYCSAKYENGRISYMGVRQDENTVVKKWTRVDTFGGKITENIVQAIARDCLMEAIMKLDQKGYEINFHVHDEVIVDAFNFDEVKTIESIMSEPIEWAPGLILKACGYECKYYMKD